MDFITKVLSASRRNRSLLCVGLDSDIRKIPQFLKREFGDDAVLEFNKHIIEATKDLVCAYKPNIAFYEMLGPKGLELLKKTREYIPADIPVIIDAKRGDIANSAEAYAKALFEIYGADAVTANPYLGYDALEPFLRYREKCTFLLCRTSNPGARDLQDLDCDGCPLYQVIAKKAIAWNSHHNIGLVMGATFPEELGIIRKIVGDGMPILILGIGPQGADLQKAVQKGVNSRGELAIINAARSVIFASSGRDFAQAARRAAQTLRDEINRYRVTST